MSSPLRVGLIGCGGIARWAHMPGWKEVPDAQVTAVCDNNRATAEAFAKEFGIAPTRVFTDFNELAKLNDLDVVDICTPNMFHTPAALASLNAGKHVLCEKPLAVTTAEVRQIGAAAKKNNKLVMTGHDHRWGPSGQAVKRYVDSGAVGDIYYARIHAVRRCGMPVSPTFIDNKISGGGPCMDIGVHALDLGMWLMGFPDPVRVSGVTRVNFAHGNTIPSDFGTWDPKNFTVEDFASGFIHFANGATMVLESAWLQHQRMGEDFSAHVFGNKASVHWPSREYATVLNGIFVDGKLHELYHIKNGQTGKIMAFADAVRTGKPSPVPVEQTIKVIAILEAIVESGKTGKEVVIAGAALKAGA